MSPRAMMAPCNLVGTNVIILGGVLIVVVRRKASGGEGDWIEIKGAYNRGWRVVIRRGHQNHTTRRLNKREKV